MMIRELREDMGLSQIELAEAIGVSERTMRRYEQEEDSIQIGTLKKIFDVLGMSSNNSFFVQQMSSNPINDVQHSKNVTKSSNECYLVEENENVYKSSLSQSFYTIPVLSIKASAGRGNDIMELESYESGEVMCIDKGFFKSPPNAKVRIIQVDGYSMIPMLLPDSWVIFEESDVWRGDGLYVLNYDNELMVKLLQKLPNGNLEIISANKDYKSFVIERDTQSVVRIVGKVLRSIL
ncbi:LexA family transcriptional regulator [Helicobacter sp. MIT 03-1614]|uniref:XRE family transcriptional regulator n=1 Tax=Helicobacter sp. MIT 03-1614 TaxID=1548147 RepID=UPI001F3837FF|nr:LexA family transcriptional regulator [Helicobacter sp. MIT 03-1614]